ncbi:hypothetical protein FRC10_007437 [Ceratobasidium sp. 414]|nr:hypothetical protein FRC10_007437 [Ceratobasidium sp. 414]
MLTLSQATSYVPPAPSSNTSTLPTLRQTRAARRAETGFHAARQRIAVERHAPAAARAYYRGVSTVRYTERRKVDDSGIREQRRRLLESLREARAACEATMGGFNDRLRQIEAAYVRQQRRAQPGCGLPN